MKKNIVQFVCFETNLEFDQFISNWEHYAKKFESKEIKSNLLEQVMTAKSRFKYVSQHMAPLDELQFTFMKEKKSVILPESKIKVVQAGGYKPLQIQSSHSEDPDATKILLFIAKSVYDIEPFKGLEFAALNIYEAYFESCNYSYILEFFVNDGSEELVKTIRELLHNPEIGVYKECLVMEG